MNIKKYQIKLSIMLSNWTDRGAYPGDSLARLGHRCG